ncbi:MAG: ABC transporter permease [Steroidobacteraceae bacterium]
MSLRSFRIDRLGALLVALGAASLLWLPFAVFKQNRIMPGDALGLFSSAPAPAAYACLGALCAAALVALFVAGARLRFAVALLGIVLLAGAIAAAGNALTPPGNRVVRVAPGAACWSLLAMLVLLAADALTRLRPRPLVRVLLLCAVAAGVAFALGSGAFDHLSVMREYAVNAERFTRELQRHLWLAFGSLGVALCLALPLGILCHRVPRLRAGTLVTLNLVQTIPAIALFGILMAPLAALAANVPLAARLGIHGIGAAPAVIALFLYSLLPIVANTVVGLKRVSPAAVEAARGMGMTGGQVLSRIEMPLALPVILTGVRIVLVQNIGLVTIAALIGAGGLGAFVFQGIGQTAIDLVLLGALPTVALAFAASVLLDALIESMERSP